MFIAQAETHTRLHSFYSVLSQNKRVRLGLVRALCVVASQDRAGIELRCAYFKQGQTAALTVLFR